MSKIFHAKLFSVACFFAFAFCNITSAHAYAPGEGVGLGVAGGVAYSPTKIGGASQRHVDSSSFAWGFFVDIPLARTFYISPSTMLYSQDFGSGKGSPVTDVDLNFKFIVPISALRLGAGITAGIANSQADYSGHYGALGFLSYNIVSNVDVFAMVQYKQRSYRDAFINNVHSFLGAMFYF